MRHIVPIFFLVAFGVFFTSCNEKIIVGPSDPPPDVMSLVAAPNPNNVVSAIATVKVQGAADVVIEYGDSTTGFAAKTKAVSVAGDSAVVPVVGLRGGRTYKLRGIARSDKGVLDTGVTVLFTTSPLPDDLPVYSITTNRNPSPGYVMLGFTGSQSDGRYYALIVDNAGQVVWYRKFLLSVTDFQKQPNGSFTVYSSHDGSPRRYLVMDILGNVVGEYASTQDPETDSHELRLGSDGSRVLMGIDSRTMDLTAFGGSPTAKVDGMTIEYHRPGTAPFHWSTFDHMEITEAADDINLAAPMVRPWHGNAIDVDNDGNLLVSFRNSDVVVKIDVATGNILWRLGGKRSDFTFVDDPFNGFSHQHGIRRLPGGTVILFDNGNGRTPQRSRGVEYRLDETAGTAQRVWEYLSDPALYSFALGMADRNSNGNTLLCYGITGNVIETDPAGTKQWELALNDPQHFIYRAFRIESLY